MNMPGFTAEASLYETSGHYRRAPTGASAALVLPQVTYSASTPTAARWCCDLSGCRWCYIAVVYEDLLSSWRESKQ